MKSIDLHIHSNTDCNLSCKHCYNNSGEGKTERIDLTELKRYLEITSQIYDCDIHLEGGEIFLYPELFDILYDLDDSILKSITITTNGTIKVQNTNVISVLKRINALRISVEGHTQEIHEKVRNSSLDFVLTNGIALLNMGINVVLRITLNRYNQDSLLIDGITKFYQYGYKKIQIYEFQEVGRGNNNAFSITCDFKQIFKQFESVAVPVDLKMMLSSRRIQDVQDYPWNHHNLTITYNDENENGISINANGEISLCAWNDQEIIANFSQMSNAQILAFLNSRDFFHTCTHCSKVVLHKEP